MPQKSVGFDYRVSAKSIKEYQAKSLKIRLTWLYQGNRLRKSYPKRIIELQNKFREGMI